MSVPTTHSSRAAARFASLPHDELAEILAEVYEASADVLKELEALPQVVHIQQLSF